MNPIAMSWLANDHIRDLHASAARHRLIARARRCRPTTWRRAAAHLTTAGKRFADSLGRGQLGPAADYCACR